LSEIRYPLTGQVALIDFKITIYLRWNAMINRLVGGRRSAIQQRKKPEDVVRPRSPPGAIINNIVILLVTYRSWLRLLKF